MAAYKKRALVSLILSVRHRREPQSIPYKFLSVRHLYHFSRRWRIKAENRVSKSGQFGLEVLPFGSVWSGNTSDQFGSIGENLGVLTGFYDKLNV